MKKSSNLPGSPDMIKDFNRPGGRYIPAWIKGNEPHDKTEVKTKVKQRRKSKKET